MFITIYIIGYILFVALLINNVLRKYQKVTVGDCLASLLIGLFSWVGAFIFTIVKYENIVVYEKKKKE